MDLQKPAPLDLSTNAIENWSLFKEQFEIYILATDYVKKSTEVKAGVFLNLIGRDALCKIKTLDNYTSARSDVNDLISLIDSYVRPKKNILCDRFRFYNRTMKIGEPFDDFLADVIRLAANCEFQTEKESLIRDRIALGHVDCKVKEILLQKSPNLEKTITICRSMEVTREQINVVHGDSTQAPTVDFIKNNWRVPSSNSGDSAGQSFNCKRCGRSHKPKSCPAFGKKCSYCNGFNHFSVGCFKKKKVNIVHDSFNGDSSQMSDEDKLSIIESISVYQVSNKNNIQQWFVDLKVNDMVLNFKVDSGAEVNVLPYELFLKIGLHITELRKTSMILEAFGGSKIVPMGEIDLEISYKSKSYLLKFIVIKGKFTPLLGLPSSITLNILSFVHSLDSSPNREMFIRNNIEVFSGIGKMDFTVSLSVNPSIKPVIKAPRRVPFALHNKLKSSLEELIKSDIICKVDEPASWASNLVIVEKPDKTLRICLDPCELNKAIITPHFLIPTMEDARRVLANKSFFSVLDLRAGFLQVQLDKESSDLCTFSTIFGFFKYKRLPFGLKCSPEIFQRAMSNYFGHIENVFIYFDDLLIAGNTIEEHDNTLKKVLEVAKSSNIKFNPDKIQYRLNKIKFLGHIFSSTGMELDTDRISAIMSLRSPTCITELQRILGMVNYFREFIPNLSELISPFRDLLKKDTSWIWTNSHNDAFNLLKEKVNNSPVLANFDEHSEITIQCDASKDGLGSCLLQNNRPIMFASRCLTATEQNYAQIEKEMLAIVFSVLKFHRMIYGRSVKIITDHKPLVSIFLKDICKINSHRLQRLRLKTIQYDLNVEYQPGKYLLVADLLSRNYIDSPVKDDKTMLERVHTIDICINNDILSKFKDIYKKDSVMNNLKKFYVSGWPSSNNTLCDGEKFFWKFRNDIFVKDEFVYLNDKLIVPKAAVSLILSDLHSGHFGINKMYNQAKELMFWPLMKVSIENYVNNCLICQKYQKSCVKEPLINHEIPKLPFFKVGSDIFELRNKNYLVVVDFLSKWFELVEIECKTAKAVIAKLKLIFCTHGIPSFFVADNMPFNSFEFRNFAHNYGFKIITSSPHYSQSNGMAERTVQTAKKMLNKCFEDGSDIHLALLQYRSMPTSIGLSPSQILMSRRLKTKVPISENFLEPVVHKNITSKFEEKQRLSKSNYDKNARNKSEFHLNEKVFVQSPTTKLWDPSQIVGVIDDRPRSYLIKSPHSDGILRRNSRFIRPDRRVLSDSNSASKNDNNLTCVPTGKEKISRYGRQIKAPAFLNDYVT